MIIHIDISGQITQKNMNSALALKSSDGFEYSVFLRAKDKKFILNKYKFFKRIEEKVYCIMVFYLLNDKLDKNIEEIVFCRDVNFRKVKNILLKTIPPLKNFIIRQRDSDDFNSLAHKVALKTFQGKRKYDILITKKMIEEKLRMDGIMP
ncbi:MAG: hypothetical protein QXM96_03125 [Candidatus Woesearchaeota archaeon]